ncbi:MAG: hypothetical protein JXA99_02275, partial [Candidatus Lokiarchaeota archaeon]|nr:hypothetical protein [Candidatus Lokiarchaeota archaeon]
EFFQIKPIWPEKLIMSLYRYGANVSGNFIAQNITTPTTVMNGICTPQKIEKELNKAKNKGYPYTHVGFSIFIDSYTMFIKNAKKVKEFDKNIITIAGNIGSLFEKTKEYVDYICSGDGVLFFRKLFGEDINQKYNLKLTRSQAMTDFFGLRLKSEMAYLTTKLGCPYKCDFCGTYQLFKGHCTPPLFSPQEVHDAIIQYSNEIKKKFLLFIAEPTAIISKKWWYELFDLFKGEGGDYPIYTLTTTKSLLNFDFDRISNSDLYFQAFNLGIESVTKNYEKNLTFNNYKFLIKKLFDYGIATYATYMIGFDHHTHDNVWEDMYKLIDLDATVFSILNLKPIPGTPIWNDLSENGRILDVPYDLYYLQGFQPFLHPHFKPGFEDMLPLLSKIHAYFERETGSFVTKYIKLYENLEKLYPNKDFKKDLKKYKSISKILFNSWKENLNPSEKQINNYCSAIEDFEKIPLQFKLIKNLSSFKKHIQKCSP